VPAAVVQELDHALDAVDDVGRLLVPDHLHQDVARVELPLYRHLLAALDLHDLLHRDECLADQPLGIRSGVLRDALRDRKMRAAASDVFKRLQDKATIVVVLNDPAKSQQMPGVAATVNDQKITVRELAEEANVCLSVEEVEPVAHWVTPAVEIRRYDTRFFLARMPPDQHARHDESETTALVWLTPAEALRQVLGLLSTLGGPPHNLVLHTAPLRERVDATYHWHWEIHPRLREIAGLELLTIDARTTAAEFRRELRWNSAFYYLDRTP